MLYQARSVTDEAARYDELTIRVHGWNRMTCSKCNDLLNPAVEKNIITDEQRSGLCLEQAREGSIDFAIGACIQYLNLQPDDRSRHQHISRCQLRYRIVRILKKTDRRSAGH